MKNLLAITVMLLATVISGCDSVDQERIPSMGVYIDLRDPGMWTKYGVSGYGNYRVFNRSKREPRDFAWTQMTATGFGGVLLICGTNPYTLEAAVPLAYDMACPVERKADITVKIESNGMIPIAVCPKCGSTYDVCERGGSPISGIALGEKVGLTRFECTGSGSSWLITSKY